MNIRAAWIALVMLGGTTAGARQEPTFRASADVVAVDVSVRSAGRPVTGLTVNDFELFDNAQPQQISDLTYEKLPIDVIVALDVSGSVTGSVLDQLRGSLQELRAGLTPRDRLKLLTFNMRIKQVVDFGAPASATDAALTRVTPAGSTSIFDAIAVSLTSSSSADRRQLVVLFSDGEDTGSITDPVVLLDVARRTTPTLDVLLASSLGTEATVSARSLPRNVAMQKMYTDLARETGGLMEVVSGSGRLSSTFRRMLEQFRSSYVLHFAPKGVERSGVHTLDVRVKRSGVDIRARKSYVWSGR